MKLTPMMQQYFQIKENYKDCILFFRLGDFYEMFFEDAEIASKELELVLTGRDCGLEKRAPMCGIPFHASNAYIGRLVSKGYKVAICEQVEDPATAKGIVKRDVIRVITPGTFTDEAFIDECKNNFIMSLYVKEEDNLVSISFADISTGEFYNTSFRNSFEVIFDEISKFKPKEIILNSSIKDEIKERILEFNLSLTEKDDDYFNCDKNINLLSSNLGEKYIESKEICLFSSSALIAYILDTQKLALSNINSIEFYNIKDTMTIDINSRRNLELTENIRDKTKKGSLLWVLDKTSTAMGSRTLRRWIEQPLISKSHIENRLESVEELLGNLSLMEDLYDSLKSVYDIERILGKIAAKSVNAKELMSLKNSISNIPPIKSLISNFKGKLFKDMYDNLDDLRDIFDLIDEAIEDTPSLSIKDGNIIKTGYNTKVDEFRSAKTDGKEWIATLENKEREFTGIKSLKVGYNKVFGYYIEISKANYSSIPEGRYIRKQTLSNAERFITEDLKEVEEKILGAEEKLIALEYNIFVDIRDKIEKEIDRMKKSGKLLAELDCLLSFSKIALDNNYTKPVITTKDAINIKNGRHPVVEKVIPQGDFVSNDTEINKDDKQLLIITGPNMAGKSTYMRQVALITLMAQIGSFVPADYAEISICDKIFTRIGASDDLSGGKSTFMVEMWEVSNILNNATSKSLVLLDEVGRGTSTYDGLSIAWSVIEHICSSNALKCKTLFATHYHELTDLEGKISGVKNYSVAVKEVDNNVIFLRKIVEGGADQSYGIEVARLAGLPKSVIERAKDILSSLENNNINKESIVEVTDKSTKPSNNKEVAIDVVNEPKQLSFTDVKENNLIEDIKNIDILSMTPIDAINTLFNLVKKAKELN
ncbi:DNA mismatch repair protein MutS [Clostridium sp.]|uniref:DNA mismatch repair protein MutS n=1 Tax=Clostridium sp. TaxID=1506 RepID=UPI003463CEAE